MIREHRPRVHGAALLSMASCLSVLALVAQPVFGRMVVGAGAQWDFSDFLITRDLVVRGTLLSKAAVQHDPAGGCGTHSQGAIGGWDFSIKPDSVLFGSLADSVLHVFMYGRPDFPRGSDLPGQVVIAYAVRRCPDPSTYWGGCAPIAADGAILAPRGTNHGLLDAGPGPAQYHTLLARLAQKRLRHPTAAIEGAAGLVLLRVRSVTPEPGHGYRADCDSLGWAAGSGSQVPRMLVFNVLPGCHGVSAGDTVLIPIPMNYSGQSLTLDLCPSGLVADAGMIPALSCKLADISNALILRPSGMHVITSRHRR